MKDAQLNDIFSQNRDLWNRKTDLHVASAFYDNASFIAGRTSLNDIELEYLQDIEGKSVLHVQCHFGQDSISMARMGATVTGTDISDRAIEEARKLNEACATTATFVRTPTYDLDKAIQHKYDLIYMSYGVICWLPDLHRLAGILTPLLNPQGRILLVEFHPALMMYEMPDERISYSYHNVDVYEEEDNINYADGTKTVSAKEYFWQHSIEESIMPFVAQGLHLSAFREYLYSPYNLFDCFEEKEKGKYVFGTFPYPLPHVYLAEFTHR